MVNIWVKGTATFCLNRHANVDTQAYIVTVKAIGELTAFIQRTFERHGDSAFAAAGQTGKPDSRTFLPQNFLTVVTLNFACVPMHVCCNLFGYAVIGQA